MILIAAEACPARSCDLDFGGPGSGPHQIVRTIDARTLGLADRTELRLASILPPTRFDSPAAMREWPPERAAIRALDMLTSGLAVHLAREREAPDRYGRILAQARLAPAAPLADAALAHSIETDPADALWLQARLVAAGHARVALTPETSTACARVLLGREAAAEQDRRGLWAEALYHPKPAAEPRALLAHRSTFQIVAGTVARVAIQRSAIYLNFSEDWQRDFTARIAPGVLKRAGIPADSTKRLENRPVRIRGWIERRRGPLIVVWRPEQIELLEPGATGAPRRFVPPRFLGDPPPDAPAPRGSRPDRSPKDQSPSDGGSSVLTDENTPMRD